MAVATAILNGNFHILTETEELAIIRHMTGAPLYWEAFSTCGLVLLSSVSNIMLNKCSNDTKTLGGGGERREKKLRRELKCP